MAVATRNICSDPGSLTHIASVNRAPTISAVILAQNEERHIGACLRGLTWADERLVLDGGSCDSTIAIARLEGAVVHERPFDQFSRQRQHLLELTTTDWVLFVDADERVSAGLAAEIRMAIARTGPDVPAGYWIPRRNYFWGVWVRGGGWEPDAQLRLFRRSTGRYDPHRPVHELVRIDGKTDTLTCAFAHYNYETVGQFLRKQRRYAAIEASARRKAGERGRVRRLVSAPLREFLRRYLHLAGFQDGATGFLLAGLAAWSAADTQRRLLSQG